MPKRYIDNGSQIYGYLLGASSRDDALKKALREETSALPDLRMQITPEQGQFMALLVKLTGQSSLLRLARLSATVRYAWLRPYLSRVV